jgi:hypothetical protein
MQHFLRITIIVVVTGIIAFIKIGSTKAKPFPTTAFIIWLIVSAILIGITIWSRLGMG